MTCEHFSNGKVDVFICTRASDTERCACGNPSVAHCDFELRGPKAGTRCDRPLCERCAAKRADKVMCQAHGNMKPGQ